MLDLLRGFSAKEKEVEIGVKIRDLRLKARLTQGELADRCELTKGYISQLENDLTSPSIATLKDILQTLGSSLTDFFADEGVEKQVFGQNDYFIKTADGQSITWLVPTAQKNAMEPIKLTLEEGRSSEKDLPHDGEEFGFVLKGKIRLHIGKKTTTATTGESFYYRADKTHFLENIGKGEAEILWLSCPPNF